jgi:hypothetical protein
MDELEFVNELIARLPARRDQEFVAENTVRVGSHRAPLSSSFGGITSEGPELRTFGLVAIVLVVLGAVAGLGLFPRNFDCSIDNFG